MPDLFYQVVIAALVLLAFIQAWRAPEVKCRQAAPEPERKAVLIPKPQSPSLPVDLMDGKIARTVHVTARTQRVFYGGRAYDHTSTTSDGRWVYTVVDKRDPKVN